MTTVARTLLDLASVLDRARLEQAVNEAEVLQLGDEVPLTELLERYPRRPGSRSLREVLATHSLGNTVTRSELEDRFLTFIDELGLPRPEMNALVATRRRAFEVDCLWRASKVIVELDGRAFHDTSRSFEHDRERDRILNAAGFRVIRVTWTHLAHGRMALADDLTDLVVGS